MKDTIFVKDLLKAKPRSFKHFPVKAIHNKHIPWKTAEDRKHPVPTYYDDMKPLYLTLFLLGRFPAKFTKYGMEKSEFLSLSVMYTVVCTTFQILLSAVAIDHITEVAMAEATHFDQKPFLFAMIIILTMNFSIPVTHWLDTNTNAAFNYQMASFQEEFMWSISMLNSSTPSAWIEHFVVETRASRGTFIRFMSYINLPFVALIISILTIFLVEMPIYVCAPFLFIFMSIFAATLTWCMNCFYLKKFAEILSEQTVKAVRSGTLADLRWCRLSWCKLSHLTREIGFSCQFSAIVGNVTMGVSFVITCYAGLAAYYTSRFSRHTMGILMGLPFNTYVIYITFKSAHDVTKKIGLTFAHRLLSEDLSHLNARQSKEIEYFLQCLQLVPPVIKVGDFVTLDKSLITNFASNVITYLIVLIQFSGYGKMKHSHANYNETALS